LHQALYPDASRERDGPDYAAILPYSVHPLARATLVKKVVSGSVPEFMSLVVEWLQSRYKPLSLGAMLCDLEPTAVQWKMLSELGGPRGTAIFKV